MIDFSLWQKGWALLDGRERRNAWIVLAVVAAAALSSAAMIGSVMPFLSVLADPSRIRDVEALAWAYEAGGFSSDYGFLIALGLASLLVILAANLMQMLRIWAVTRYTTARMHTLSRRLLTTYLRQPYEFFLDHHSGSMGTQILSEAQTVVQQFFVPASDIAVSLLTIAVVIALLVWVNPVVALTCLAVFGGIYGATYLLSRSLLTRAGKVRAQANRARYRIAGEALGGIRDVKLLGLESAFVFRFREPSQRMARSQLFAGLVSQLPQYFMQTLAFGGMILLCLALIDPASLASGRTLGGLLPLLGVFAFAGQRLMPELSRLYVGLTRIQYVGAAVEAVHADLANGTIDEPMPETPASALGLKQELRLEQVGYRYPRADDAGLDNISLSIRAGEKIGVVGSTGAGKTTLANVILGLLRPKEGALVVDGTPITDANIRAWQRSLGYVPQDIFLTDSSAAENIALGIAPDKIDRARVQRAARIAQMDRFIREELPDGYDTTVGERGVRLSGGQRQRIGIARAMYHDADLIVFDEATSALDNITEREVMAAIDNLPGDKTVLIIAHRLTTVQHCDRILMLDKGRVAGFDTWDRLMAANKGFQGFALAGGAETVGSE